MKKLIALGIALMAGGCAYYVQPVGVAPVVVAPAPVVYYQPYTYYYNRPYYYNRYYYY